MSNLRDIVRRHIESETKSQLADHSPEAQNQMIEMLRREGHIDRKIQEVLDAYLRDIEQNSPIKKRRKYGKAIYAIVVGILTALIAYSVNETNWILVWGLIAVQGILSIAYIFFVEE